MLSLRSLHLIFLFFAIVGADLFGIWSVWTYLHNDSALTLALGVVSLLGGAGLLVYAFRFVKMADRAHIT